MCFDTAFKDISKGSATSVTRASLRESRSMIARRVGSARAANTASRRAVREAGSFRASISIMTVYALDSRFRKYSTLGSENNIPPKG
jgi:hypothetical protein